MGRGRGKQRKEAEAAREEEERRRLLEASPLRKEAVEAMRLDREGRHEEAIARADELAAKHPESAFVLHLAAGLHQNASTRAAGDGSDGQASVMHLVYARDFYAQAKRLAPNCVQIATGFAMAKVPSAKDYEPDREIMRALAISSPTDPAENNVAFDLDRTLSTAMDRLAKAREAALFHSHHIMSHMSAKVIPRVVVDMLDISKREGAATAKKRAKKALVERFDYSARAHLTHAKISLDFARGLDPNIDKKPFLNGILDALNNLVEEFSNSLEIAMFRAKLLFVLGKYCSVELECDRAICMEEPTDPREEDVPPGSIPGEKPEDRKSYIRAELKRLVQKLVLVCRDYWCSLASEKQDSFRLVGLKSLHEHFVVFYQDVQEAAKTISDALNFVKKNKSWRFWICPYCVGKKIPDIDSLLQHMRSKHPEGGFWTKLLSVLDPKPISDTYQGATICQDSEENYVLHFKRMDHIFKYLFLRAADKIEEKSFSQIREEKCRKGVFILEKIKLKLNNAPTDILRSEFNEACAEIRDLWHYFLEISLMDYRVAISPLAMCFILDRLLKCMTEDKEAVSNSIDAAAINAVFPFVDVCPDIDAIFPNVDDAPDGNDADTSTSVTHGQSDEEMSSVDVLNKENRDENMLFLHVVIQSLWNLRCFRDEILRAPPVTILHINENFCIADLFYGIFFAWEKNEHNGVDVLLTSMKDNLCKIANGNMFQKLQAGKGIASEVVATILQALHMSETPLHFDFNYEIEEREVSPVSCGDCICRTHFLFGIKFQVQMSCRCGKCFGEKEHTTIFYRLDASSPQTTKIKSFAELPVLYDEKSCFEDNCKHCGSPKNVDVSPSNTPHFFTIGLYWFGDSENQVQLSEVLVGIAHPIDIKLLCKGVHSSAKYSLASMISYANGRYICFARDQDKWLICDGETVEAEDSWDQLLGRFRGCRLQPEVLFFEIIKWAPSNIARLDW
uniref:USP domain-containing protein n=2 Tax=Oryza punctata TaxID=4537 RepID=A0A0E0LER0_ORYPU